MPKDNRGGKRAGAKVDQRKEFGKRADITYTMSESNGIKIEAEISFSMWEGYGKKRIYFDGHGNARKLKGYIDLNNGNAIHVIKDVTYANKQHAEAAAQEFLRQYKV